MNLKFENFVAFIGAEPMWEHGTKIATKAEAVLIELHGSAEIFSSKNAK